MAENNFEVVTTTDKDQRDRLFQDLRRNGNQLEKQVVKFSGWETRPLKSGQFISNWSVAYPNKPDSNPTDRRRRHDEQH